MTQEFDIYRELWDYCDDSSKRVVTFYPPAPEEEKKSPDFLDQVDEVLTMLDEKDKEETKEEKQNEPPILNTSTDIWDYVKKISEERKTVCK